MSKKLKAYKFRMYPNVTQRIMLSKTFGCVRMLWNNLTATFNSYDKDINPNPKYLTSTEFRKTTDWLSEVSAAALQQKQKDFQQTKSQYFNKKRKVRIGKMSFKTKRSRQSFRLPNQKFKLTENKIRLEKIGWVRIVIDREIPTDSKLMSVTISKTPTNEYYASILVEQEIKHKKLTNENIGIDVGLKEFYTTSDNNVVHNPRCFSESQRELKRIQQHLSRKKKGSSRFQKCKLKAAKVHQKITRQRDWFLHNLSTDLVNNFDIIAIEDLNVKGMVKNRRLAKSISDVSWSKFYSMLEYKCKWYGKVLVKVNRFEPTSKTCSCCGWVKKT